jgi:hypothetical protein
MRAKRHAEYATSHQGLRMVADRFSGDNNILHNQSEMNDDNEDGIYQIFFVLITKNFDFLTLNRDSSSEIVK